MALDLLGVSSTDTLAYELKMLEVTQGRVQGHWKQQRSIDCVRLHIGLLL